MLTFHTNSYSVMARKSVLSELTKYTTRPTQITQKYDSLLERSQRMRNRKKEILEQKKNEDHNSQRNEENILYNITFEIQISNFIYIPSSEHNSYSWHSYKHLFPDTTIVHSGIYGSLQLTGEASCFQLLQMNLKNPDYLTARTNLGTQEFRENKQNKLWVSHGTGVSKLQPCGLTSKIFRKKRIIVRPAHT